MTRSTLEVCSLDALSDEELDMANGGLWRDQLQGAVLMNTTQSAQPFNLGTTLPNIGNLQQLFGMFGGNTGATNTGGVNLGAMTSGAPSNTSAAQNGGFFDEMVPAGGSGGSGGFFDEMMPVGGFENGGFSNGGGFGFGGGAGSGGFGGLEPINGPGFGPTGGAFASSGPGGLSSMNGGIASYTSGGGVSDSYHEQLAAPYMNDGGGSSPTMGGHDMPAGAGFYDAGNFGGADVGGVGDQPY